ncbi:MAG: hypothetical protein IPK10_08295 [Bacteroidetes bacterium]|nr:hypothetical protein [Bacteroidota bacterium]
MCFKYCTNRGAKNYLDLIRKSADTLLVIVNDILDLSKIDSGKMTFEEIPFNLKDTFSASVAAFIPKTIEKRLNLELKYRMNFHKKLLVIRFV